LQQPPGSHVGVAVALQSGREPGDLGRRVRSRDPQVLDQLDGYRELGVVVD
jgi:hypothetical protein